MRAAPLSLLALVAATGLAALWLPRGDPSLAPEVVSLAAREFAFRPAGDYRQGGRPVDPPLRREWLAPGFAVMKYQVSQAEYARCVNEGDCPALVEGEPPARPDLPLTGASLMDAQAYAAWLSRRTGQRWRLPSDREWAFFAASRWADDALRLDDDGSNPARRWLARYRFEARAAADGPGNARPRDGHGLNELGVADLAGNVWEWTQSCQSRVELDADGRELVRSEACGLRIVEGRHRAVLNDFVRDARGGGCSAGQPPDNLGIRLIREGP